MLGFPNLLYRGMTSVEQSVILPMGAVLHPGVRTVYVRSTGPQSGDPPGVTGKNLYPTINAAAAVCRSGLGDVIMVLPGHVESISTANALSNLVAGTNIIGCGAYGVSPKLTFSAAAAQFALSVANVQFSNIRFECAGAETSSTALTVANPFAISASGVGFHNCTFQVGVDADQLCTKAITATDAANDLAFNNCVFFGNTAAECTTVLDINGADNLRMVNTHVVAATSSTTVGVMRLNATALVGGLIANCTFSNMKAASIHAVTGVASSQGICKSTLFCILDNATLAGWVTPANWVFDNLCSTVNLAGETAAVKTVIST